MNNVTFITHPSVRIKGTENNYNPSQCFDQLCTNKSAHMHCPFCVKTDIYQDPVILKAHYRVKHVDKGIDFAGLKILRCCDHCDIVGIIKGEKKFKGAHWHCYKCRNGFNRRDEAIKHYKTHFRNPQTTFQIQIAQEVNGPNNVYGDGNTATMDQTGISIHPALTEAVMSTSLAEESALMGQTSQVTMANGKVQDGSVHVSVAANETVDTSDGQTHHIMIIQEDALGTSSSYTTQIISSEDVRMAEEKEQSNEQNSQNKYEELQQKYHQLEEEKINTERLLKSEIDQLKMQVQSLNAEILIYQKREQELLEQVSVPLDRNIESLLKHLETQHRDLLHQQLLVIKREYKPHCLVTSSESQSLSADKNDMQETADNSVERFIIECNVEHEQDKSGYDKNSHEIVDREDDGQTEEGVVQEEKDVGNSCVGEGLENVREKVDRILQGNDNDESVGQTQELNIEQIDAEQYTYCVTESGDASPDGKSTQQNSPLVVCIEYPTTDIEKTPVENLFTIQESQPQVNVVSTELVDSVEGEPATKRQKQSL